MGRYVVGDYKLRCLIFPDLRALLVNQNGRIVNGHCSRMSMVGKKIRRGSCRERGRSLAVEPICISLFEILKPEGSNCRRKEGKDCETFFFLFPPPPFKYIQELSLSNSAFTEKINCNLFNV